MNSLSKAIAAFIAKGGDRQAMNVLAWAATYRVEPDDVRKAWETQMTKHSLTQHKNCEEMDK